MTDQTSRPTSGTEHKTEIIRDFLTAQGGHLASCSCKWQGPIRDKWFQASQDAELHHAAPNAELILARALQTGDVIVRPGTSDEMPVRLATPHDGLMMIWTDTVDAFACSPDVEMFIQRRDLAVTA